MSIAGDAGTGRRRATARWTVGVGLVALVAYPLLPGLLRDVTFVVVAWLSAVPVALSLPASPGALRPAWRLLLGGLLVSAASSTVNRLLTPSPHLVTPWVAVASIVAELLFLGAAIAVVLRRGRNDFGGVLDASLTALAVGGLIWATVPLPRTQASVRYGITAASVAVIVMIMAGILGALLRLIETDTLANRALRLLCLAVVLNLAAFVLVSGWPVGAPRTAGAMAYIAAYAAVGLSVLHPSAADLGRSGMVRPTGFGVGRLVLLGAALLAAPIAGATWIVQGDRRFGLVLIVANGLIVLLVIVRIGLLARQLQQSEAALRHLARHDPLTGGLNRRGFVERLETELDGGRDFTLVFCDLDGFKATNDRFGHAAGDALLVEVTRRLRDCVAEPGAVGRLGGDEFAVLVGGAGTDGVPARVRTALAARFRYAPEHPSTDIKAIPSGDIAIGASVGSVVCDRRSRDGGVTADDLLHEADAAMYAEKATRVRRR